MNPKIEWTGISFKSVKVDDTRKIIAIFDPYYLFCINTIDLEINTSSINIYDTHFQTHTGYNYLFDYFLLRES